MHDREPLSSIRQWSGGTRGIGQRFEWLGVALAAVWCNGVLALANDCDTGFTLLDLGRVLHEVHVSNTGFVAADEKVWFNGQLVATIPNYAVCEDVNDAGHVAGYLKVEGVGSRAFYFDGQDVTVLQTLMPFNQGQSYGRGLNELDHVAGYSDSIDGLSAFLWSDGSMLDLGNGGPALPSFGYDLNDGDVIVGFGYLVGNEELPARWVEGGVEYLPMLEGAEDARAFAINGVGTIVGYANYAFAQKAWKWSDGVLTELPKLPGQAIHIPYALNNLGQVVGYATAGGPAPYSAVLWDDDTIIDLQSRVSSDQYMNLEYADGINDRCWIVGRALVGAFLHAFLLKPAAPGDLDCNGEVDGEDIGLMLSAWGTIGPADLDESGATDSADLGLLLANWGW